MFNFSLRPELMAGPSISNTAQMEERLNSAIKQRKDDAKQAKSLRTLLSTSGITSREEAETMDLPTLKGMYDGEMLKQKFQEDAARRQHMELQMQSLRQQQAVADALEGFGQGLAPRRQSAGPSAAPQEANPLLQITPPGMDRPSPLAPEEAPVQGEGEEAPQEAMLRAIQQNPRMLASPHASTLIGNLGAMSSPQFITREDGTVIAVSPKGMRVISKPVSELEKEKAETEREKQKHFSALTDNLKQSKLPPSVKSAYEANMRMINHMLDLGQIETGTALKMARNLTEQLADEERNMDKGGAKADKAPRRLHYNPETGEAE